MKLELRPSVLQIGNTNTSNEETESTQKINEKVQLDNNVFKFTPLVKPNNSSPDIGQSNAPDKDSNQVAKAYSFISESSNAQDTGFVFGSNLEERVILPTTDNKSEDLPVEQKLTQKNDTAKSDNSCIIPEKRKYEAITGEEGESNVLQIFCKLYSWESSSISWKERGKGFLRLNDKMKDDKLCSRLVMRTAGSLKVILNTSIVAGMKFELQKRGAFNSLILMAYI